MPRIAIAVLAGALLALGACGSGDEQASTTTADVADTSESTAAAAAPEGLTGVVWQWQGSAYSDDTEATPDDPSRYTIEFNDDGTAGIKADCNMVRGEYTTDGSTISIALGASTKVACPDDSLDAEFLRDLEGAATYAVDSGELRIDIKFDSGSMRFAPAG